MIISSSDRIEGARSLTVIGRIRAATGWHVAGRNRARDGDWKEAALLQLIANAESVDADAVIGVNYEVDGAPDAEATGLALQRISITGMAVKIGRV